MKKLLLLFLFILVLPNAWALKGVGLQWYTEYVQIAEGDTGCVEYGVYNPWDENITIGLRASGEIEQFAILPESKFAPAETFHENAIKTKICFDIPRVYDKNCKLGPFMCEHDCSDKKTYEGEISAVERASKGKRSGTGSSTVASVAATLKIGVLCEERSITWLIIPAVIIIIVAGLLVLRWPTRSRKIAKYKSLLGDLEILRSEIAADLRNIEKRNKYEKLWKKLNNMRKKL